MVELDFRRPPEMPLEKMIARGMIPGVENIAKYGQAVGASPDSVQADIWPGGNGYTGWITSASTLDVSSDNAADTAAGTGARTVRVFGLNAAGKPIHEDVTLNGVTPVATTSTFLRCHRARVLTAGSNETNVGTLTIQTNAAEVMAIVPVGDGQTEQATFTVPAGSWAVVAIRRLTLERNVGAGVKVAKLALRVRAAGETAWRLIAPKTVASDAPLTSDGHVSLFAVGPLDDFSIRAVSGDASVTITAEMDITIFPYSGLPSRFA